MATEPAGPGVASLHLVGRVPVLHPAERMFEAMLTGWRSQQLARGLSFGTIDARERAVRRFHVHSNEWPWAWTTQHVDEWCADLRVVGRVSLSTLRGLQGSVRQFCWFVTDPVYGWVGECEREFGTHPVQVCHDEAMARHVAEVESRPDKRAFSREELQTLFDYADDHGPDQLRGVRVCSVAGATSSLPITKQKYQATLVLEPDYTQCVQQLLSEQVDAVTTDGEILRGYARRQPNQLAVVGEPFTTERYGIGYRKGDRAFCQVLTDIITTAERDGDWEKAFKRTLGKGGGQTPQPSPPDDCQQ